MIEYEPGLGFIATRRGSVMPRAFCLAIPSAIFAFVVAYTEVEGWTHFKSYFNGQGVNMIWSGYTFILGFLVVFRTQQAYSRYWEGTTLFVECRTNWFTACSNLVAFCTPDASRREEVQAFQHLLVRLFSLLSSLTLQSISDLEPESFPCIDIDGFDQNSMEWLQQLPDVGRQVEVVMMWLQRLTTDASSSKLLDVPAPILSRVYHQLGIGAVQYIRANVLTDVVFPFPYAQLLVCLLSVYSLLMPFTCGLFVAGRDDDGFVGTNPGTPFGCALLTHILVMSLWGVNLIAEEIERPFGDDSNDLPLALWQENMNASLWVLLSKESQICPGFSFDKDKHLDFALYQRTMSASLSRNASRMERHRTTFQIGGINLKHPRMSSKYEGATERLPSISGFSTTMSAMTSRDSDGKEMPTLGACNTTMSSCSYYFRADTEGLVGPRGHPVVSKARPSQQQARASKKVSIVTYGSEGGLVRGLSGPQSLRGSEFSLKSSLQSQNPRGSALMQNHCGLTGVPETTQGSEMDAMHSQSSLMSSLSSVPECGEEANDSGSSKRQVSPDSRSSCRNSLPPISEAHSLNSDCQTTGGERAAIMLHV